MPADPILEMREVRLEQGIATGSRATVRVYRFASPESAPPADEAPGRGGAAPAGLAQGRAIRGRLAALPIAEARWREIVRIDRPSAEAGRAPEAAARRHARRAWQRALLALALLLLPVGAMGLRTGAAGGPEEPPPGASLRLSEEAERAKAGPARAAAALGRRAKGDGTTRERLGGGAYRPRSRIADGAAKPTGQLAATPASRPSPVKGDGAFLAVAPCLPSPLMEERQGIRCRTAKARRHEEGGAAAAAGEAGPRRPGARDRPPAGDAPWSHADGERGPEANAGALPASGRDRTGALAIAPGLRPPARRAPRSAGRGGGRARAAAAPLARGRGAAAEGCRRDSPAVGPATEARYRRWLAQRQGGSRARAGGAAGLVEAPRIVEALRRARAGAAPPSIDLGILFAFDLAGVGPAALAQLKEVADALRSPPLREATVVVEGHTDDVGSAGYNAGLSLRRAESVRRALIERFGLAPGRLAVRARGEAAPVATNATAPGRHRNRRVSFINLGNCAPAGRFVPATADPAARSRAHGGPGQAPPARPEG